MRFDLDEPLFPLDDALPGLLTGQEMDALISEWGAAKVDEWCAVAALKRAADALRSATGVPANARIEYAVGRATWTDPSRDPRVSRALDTYHAAASAYEGARAALADIRNRAAVPAA